MILDGVVVFIGIFNLTGKKMPKGTCSYTGTINTYFFFLGFNYFICLSIEVLIKIKKPMNLKHKKRLKVYHFFCHFAAFAVTLSVALEKEIGASFHQRCVINYRSQSVYLLVVPVVVYLPVLISTLHMACRLTKDRSFFNYFFIKHTLYISIYLAIWLPVILNILLKTNGKSEDEDLLTSFSVVLISSSSLILTFIRVGGHFLIKFLSNKKKKLDVQDSFTENSEALITFQNRLFSDPDIVEPDYFAAFNSLSTESAFTAIIVLKWSLFYCPEIPKSKEE